MLTVLIIRFDSSLCQKKYECENGESLKVKKGNCVIFLTFHFSMFSLFHFEVYE